MGLPLQILEIDPTLLKFYISPVADFQIVGTLVSTIMDIILENLRDSYLKIEEISISN